MSDEKTLVYTPKTPEEIETLAWDIHGGRIFGSWDCPPDMIRMCFMVLAFLEAKDIEAMKELGIVHVYEYIDKAGPRSFNGLPSFMSMNMLNIDDMKKVLDRLTEIEAFRKSSGPS